MDEYSNILYVKESPAAMSHLAHRVSLDDKYRPESCCIIGNYYSLSSMHEKVKPCLNLASTYKAQSLWQVVLSASLDFSDWSLQPSHSNCL